MQQQKKQRPNPKPMEKAMSLTQFGVSDTDPMGSYTGRPADPKDIPVQDADDL